VAVVAVAEAGVGHWVHTAPRAWCAHNAQYSLGAEVRLHAEARFGLEGEDDGDAAEDAEDVADSDIVCSIPAEVVEADRDRLAVDNADRKGVNMGVEVDAERLLVCDSTCAIDESLGREGGAAGASRPATCSYGTVRGRRVFHGIVLVAGMAAGGAGL
jgi:hypothetical protein